MKSTTALLLLILFVACGTKESKQRNAIVIPFEKAMESTTVIKSSDLGKTIHYIPLETIDESVLGNASEIRLCGNKILATSLHTKTVLVFDRTTGKYLNSIGRVGEGPTEYNVFSAGDIGFWIDEESDLVYFGTYDKRLVVYRTDGQFVGEVRIPDEINEEMSILCNIAFTDSLAFYMNFNGRTVPENNFSAICKKESNKLIRTFPMQFTSPPKEWEVVNGDLMWGTFVPFGGHSITNSYTNDNTYISTYFNTACWNFKNNVRFKEPFIDTLFTATADRNIPHLIFDMGKWKWPYEKRFDNIESQKRITIDYVVEGENQLYFHFHKQLYGKKEVREAYCGIFHKKTGETRIMKGDKIMDDLTGLTPFSIRRSDKNGAFYGLLRATDIIEWMKQNPINNKTIETLSKIGEEDNPVVVIVE